MKECFKFEMEIEQQNQEEDQINNIQIVPIGGNMQITEENEDSYSQNYD